VHDFVDVDAVVVGVLAKVAVAARVHQSLIAQRKQDVVIDTVEITDKTSIS
jgi:hydroxymethylpyrimidine/phosphomethylpyrimidine kinase